MPIKNKLKIYKSGGVYHIYNRGLDGRDVFKDETDFLELEGILAKYLLPFVENEGGIYKTARPSVTANKRKMNLAGEVELIAYCLMPDHFHFLVKQQHEQGITQLMRRIMTQYVMYFNKRYQRRGPLFENIYRAVLVEEETVILDLTKYIHLNPVSRTIRRFGPVETVTGSRPEDYSYSSYRCYIGLDSKKWVNNTYFNISPNNYIKVIEKADPALDKRLMNISLD